jgi:5-methyltetrahydrofolate--homocysteine methyltransferase
VRHAYENREPRALLTLTQARGRKLRLDWERADIPTPSFTGIRMLDEFPLDQIVPYIDWTPFFHAWEVRGRYPEVLQNPEAKELFEDGQRLLEQIVSERRLIARAVYGFFPANSVDDDIELYTDGSRSQVLATFYTLRQQLQKAEGQYNLALADFIAPRSTGLPDYLGAFAVTTGYGLDALCKRYEISHDDYSSILAKALADRLAEAFAEYLHRRVRAEWGYGVGEQLTNEDLVRERYRGIRPAPGYPACPDHSEKRTLFDLLQVERNAGIRLTENCMMVPESSVSGLYFAHPEATYFAVGRIGRDQVSDYARRKRMDVQTVERWLSPNLNYDPDSTSQ